MIGIGVVYFTAVEFGRLKPDALGMSVEKRYIMNDMICVHAPNCLLYDDSCMHS